MIVACVVQRCADRDELVVAQGRLDAPEQGALLVANVIAQRLAEGIERGDAGTRGALETCDPVADLAVLGEDSNDVSIGGADVVYERRQQQLLFEAKMLSALRSPELQRRVTNPISVGDARALESQREFEGDVMLP